MNSIILGTPSNIKPSCRCITVVQSFLYARALSCLERKIDFLRWLLLLNKIDFFMMFASDTFGFLAFETIEFLRRVKKVINMNVVTARLAEYVF